MATGAKLHPLQQKFLDHAALQCGVCTPGFLVAAKSLLERNPDPTEEEVRYWLAGNLCRCTGYDKIVRAVLDTAADMRKASKPKPGKPRRRRHRQSGGSAHERPARQQVNEARLHRRRQAPARPDGIDKVTGRARFGADMSMPGMLWGLVLRSPHAHAKIKRIDTSAGREAQRRARHRHREGLRPLRRQPARYPRKRHGARKGAV
jgi:hypothetical protein